MTEQYPRLVFTTKIITRWADQDLYGHVNNVVYYRYFEETRVKWLQSLNFPVDHQMIGPVVIHSSCTYLQSVSYPVTLLCKMTTDNPGRSSLNTHLTLSTVDEPDTVVTEGSVKLVWVDHRSGQSTPIPPELRDHLTNG